MDGEQIGEIRAEFEVIKDEYAVDSAVLSGVIEGIGSRIERLKTLGGDSLPGALSHIVVQSEGVKEVLEGQREVLHHLHESVSRYIDRI